VCVSIDQSSAGSEWEGKEGKTKQSKDRLKAEAQASTQEWERQRGGGGAIVPAESSHFFLHNKTLALFPPLRAPSF